MKKLFNTLMFLALGSAATYADNTLRIADFVINAGEQKTLEIELNNDDNALSSLQFDIALPKGLTYVDGSVVKATDRITRTSHTVKVVAQKDGDYRFGIFSNEAQDKAQVAIAGKAGAILSITVKAAEDCEGGKITFNEITGSDATVAGKVEKVAVKGVDGKASVSAGELAVTSTKNLFLAGKKVVVDFNVKNDVKLSGMSAIVTLPEGASSFKTQHDFEVLFNATVTADNSEEIMLDSNLFDCSDDNEFDINGLLNELDTKKLIMIGDNDFIGNLNCFILIMCDKDTGNTKLCHHFLQPASDLASHLCIQRGKGLVQ